MAKDRKKLQHIHSSVLDKQPTAASLEVGEIAVNNAANKEFLSIKNSNDKVVRFSSDEQIITWTEKKEVMPYSGTVDNVHLDTNRSNIEIKLNQVAAHNTVKNDVVNGATDIDGELVNPSTDGGLTNGAGFAIDMSLYAMQGANPSFSSVTTTCGARLEGTTKIVGGSGDCGSQLTIETSKTDIKSCDEVKLESKNVILTNGDCGEGEITIEADDLCLVGKDKINIYGDVTNVGIDCDDSTIATTTNIKGATINEDATTANVNYGTATTNITEATTTIGANSTTISGNTVLSVKGTTTETKEGNVTESNLASKTENTTGVNTVNNSNNYNVNTTGVTNITSTGDTNIHSSANICETADVNASFYGAAKTNVGLNCNDSDASTVTNVYGDTINVDAETANTEVGNAVTNINTATTNISTANTTVSSAKTSILTATTTVNTSNITATTVTLDGTNLTINETNTDIVSCGRLYLNTNDFKLQQCDGQSGEAEFEFCDGFKVSSDAIALKQCGDNGSITIKEKNTTISGTNLTVNEGGNTTISTTGVTTISSNDNVCITSQKDADLYGKDNTKVGVACDGSVTTTATVQSSGVTNIIGPTTNITGLTNNNTFTTVNTTATTINQNGDAYNVTAKTEGHSTTAFTIETANACITASDTVNVGGDVNTNIGTNCEGSPISNTTNIYGDTVNESGTTNNNTFTTINNQVSNFNITGTTNINGNTNVTGDTYISGDITIGTQCGGLTSTTIADSFCEIMSRGNLTIEENHDPSDTSLAAIYTFYQNGKKVTNSTGTVVEIEVAKDKVLKSAEVVKNTSGEWVIRLTWITYDPDTQTSTETTTDVPASELVKDIDAVDTPAVNLDIWYDTASGNQKISADTTITIAAAGGNKTFSKSNATHTLSAYKLTYSHNGFSGEFDPFTANSSFTSPHSALTIDYGVDVTSKNDDTYDTSAAKTVSIPTAVSHINRGKLTVSHNGLSDTFDPATDKSLTFPHSALTATYEATSGKSGSVTYNTSGAQSISIPTSVSHLNRGTLSYSHNGASGTFDATSNVTLTSPHSALTVSFGNATGQTTSVSYDTSASKTITIPTSVSHLNRGKLTIQKNGTTIDTFDPSTDKTINVTMPTAVSDLSRGNLTVTHNGLTDTFDPATDKSLTFPHSALTVNYGAVSSSASVTYNTSSAQSITIPRNIGDVTNDVITLDGTCISVGGDICSSGIIKATALYSTSDENLKENIATVRYEDYHKTSKVSLKSFNFKDDESKKKTYGVIAQDVQKAGLNELIHTDEKGNLAVDYTSFLILKMADMEETINQLKREIKKLKGEDPYA